APAKSSDPAFKFTKGRVVAGTPYSEHFRLLSFYGDDLLVLLHFLPGIVQTITVLILWMDFFNIKILDIGSEIGRPPGNVFVVSQDDPRDAGDRNADHVENARDVQVGHMPERRSSTGEMGIVSQNGHSAGCAPASHYPVIAAHRLFLFTRC